MGEEGHMTSLDDLCVTDCYYVQPVGKNHSSQPVSHKSRCDISGTSDSYKFPLDKKTYESVQKPLAVTAK